MQCQICGTAGDNMRKCKACGVVFCDNPKCIEQRFGHRSKGCNICPACGSSAGVPEVR